MTAMSGSDIFLFLICMMVASVFAGIILGALCLEAKAKKAEEMRKKKEEEAKRKEEEEKRRKEEAMRKIKCLICNKSSMGNAVCDDCYNRSKVLIKELPFKQIHTYDLLNEYRKNLMFKIIYPETQIDRETNSVKLLSVADILKNKYCHQDAFSDTYHFFSDIAKNKLGCREELIEKYELNAQGNNAASFTEEQTTNTQKEPDMPKDFRNMHNKEYRCEDGDYVRSKAEREIDNFFFRNRIWHIYEAEYISKKNGQKYYPDFYLPDHHLYIEYFGMKDVDYIQKRDQKIQMYQADETIRFAYLTYEDDNNIYDKLKQIAEQYHIPMK